MLAEGRRDDCVHNNLQECSSFPLPLAAILPNLLLLPPPPPPPSSRRAFISICQNVRLQQDEMERQPGGQERRVRHNRAPFPPTFQFPFPT